MWMYIDVCSWILLTQVAWRLKIMQCHQSPVTCEDMLFCRPSHFGLTVTRMAVSATRAPHGSTCFALRNFSVLKKKKSTSSCWTWYTLKILLEEMSVVYHLTWDLWVSFSSNSLFLFWDLEIFSETSWLACPGVCRITRFSVYVFTC